MRPEGASVYGLTLLAYAGLSYYCVGLKVLVYATLSF
jgi:hypothetical protein